MFEGLGFGYHGVERGESLVGSGRWSGSGGGGSVEGSKGVGRCLFYVSSHLGKVFPRQFEGYSQQRLVLRAVSVDDYIDGGLVTHTSSRCCSGWSLVDVSSAILDN